MRWTVKLNLADKMFAQLCAPSVFLFLCIKNVYNRICSDGECICLILSHTCRMAVEQGWSYLSGHLLSNRAPLSNDKRRGGPWPSPLRNQFSCVKRLSGGDFCRPDAFMGITPLAFLEQTVQWDVINEMSYCWSHGALEFMNWLSETKQRNIFDCYWNTK